MMWLTLLVVLIGIIKLFWYISTYNRLINGYNAAELAWSNIEVDLKRRSDLIGNLVETVRGYAKHEQATLENVSEARGKIGNIHLDPGQAIAAQGALKTALRGLYAIVENYPELKANNNFRTLHEQLVITEDRIATRRNAYNNTVKLFTDRCQMFPSNLVAWLHGFKPQPFFDAPDDEVNIVPKVDFS